ncbi:serine/threonine-protein phosphatase [Baekduia soli]|uniref:Serine/threonine-protein phosphatase n=1 Tax=Baekduia soli TaxID=496014 RepID=A0A5B8U0H6_9ACTN|nr:PP2C family protein-serine/threonine phosphatase [Baekduia soli]QEC46519.1 serine/threonine-protein phosphatase [Baekduia soli]
MDRDPFSELLRRTHLSAPSDVGGVIAEQAAALGAADVTVHVIDYELDSLMALAPAGGVPLSVTGTMAGRAFSTTTALRASPDEGSGERLWMPLVDGTERLGTLGLTFPDGVLDEPLLALCERYAHLAAILLVAKGAYGDAIERTRRRRPMTIASELVWALAPPLVFATDGLAVSGMLEPCYDNGGDAFDYAVNGRTLHAAVLDAMGHGLAAAGVAAFAISAYRHSRRDGRDLVATHLAMDQAVGEQFPDDRFVTAIIAELDLDTGVLSWISAGHPRPLVVRGGRRARSLIATPCTPLGVPGGPAAEVAHESLQPGDLVLFFTDGLSEASREDGTRLGVEGLGAFIEREAAAGLTVAETLRRLRRSLLHATDDLADDATALLVQWRGGDEHGLLPQTVE